MTGLIFINYRREDDPGFAGRLYDKLATVYPPEQLFMDVDNIPAGRNFVRILDEKVRACDVLLAVVGRNWLDARDAKGRRRLDSPKDFVRIEIESALKAGKQIVPVLAYGARMPAADALPESLEEFALTNAVAVSHERFGADFQALLEALKGAFAQAELDRKVAEETAAEAAAEAAGKEEERLAAEKARLEAKERKTHRLTKAEIAKAEELANWDFIKQRNSAEEYRDHLQRFPDGTTSRYAKAALDEIVWGQLPRDASTTALKAYLKEFPSGAHAPEARERVAVLEREAAESAERPAGEAELSVERSRTAEDESLLAAEKPRTRRVMVIVGCLAVAAIAVGVGWFNLPYLKEWYSRFTGVRDDVRTAEQVNTLAPWDSFRDCAKDCPEMVVLPAGEFMMGSPDSDKAAHSDERPQHLVKIAAPFAVSKFEVTFAQWDACVSSGACRKVYDNGWGRGTRPVINVTWDDAKKYVNWLSRLTGKSYRLLSEAEWEYAARAGSTTAYSFGDDPAHLEDYAWYADNSGDQTHPVGEKKENEFGLRDMHGNVLEGVEDCYHDNYDGAPENGDAIVSGDCSRRVVRGGSWSDSPEVLRSAIRYRITTVDRDNNLGFRVVRTLTP